MWATKVNGQIVMNSAVQETLKMVGADPCTAVRWVGGAAAKIKIYIRIHTAQIFNNTLICTCSRCASVPHDVVCELRYTLRK